MGFATPMGVMINMNINTNWLTDMTLKLQFANSILYFITKFTTRISVDGQLSSGALTFQVGSSIQGAFLDASFDTVLYLYPFQLVIITTTVLLHI